MSVWHVIGGVVTLSVGIFLWLAFAGASAFRSGFGGDEISAAWFLIPAAVTFGGPILFWDVLPARRRKRRQGVGR
jgi:uncharacterized membrane protein